MADIYLLDIYENRTKVKREGNIPHPLFPLRRRSFPPSPLPAAMQFWAAKTVRGRPRSGAGAGAGAVGTIVVLKSAKYPNKEPVAYATLLSCDPDAEVDGVKLGNQFWKLRITFPIEENEVLVRPWHHYKTIGDAKGKTVAWPSTFVEKVNG